MNVTKAIIPTAGKGTRLRPWTFACPKAMLPLVDTGGRIRPVLHRILTEAAVAGIEQVALVVSPDQREVFERYLTTVRQSAANGLPDRVEMIVQPQPNGFGDAVLRASGWAGRDKAVAVMLGDHVYTHGPGGPCLAQLLEAHARCGGAAMVGMQPVGLDALSRVGVARGRPLPDEGDRIYLCEKLVEKPSEQTAREHLTTPGLAEDTFLAHAGLYVFSAEIFDVLAAAAEAHTDGEIELSDAQAKLLRRHRESYRLLLLDGTGHDTGTPSEYAATFTAFAAAGSH
ncbi:MAG: sugar phosphate nucleotidyltransferase [Phycisphaerae bacterium]